MVQQTLRSRLIAIGGILMLLATLAFSQTLPSVSWDGYVKRGKVRVRAGGSAWSINGVPISHTQEIYDSSDMARYILGRLKGKMRPASEIAPTAGSLQFKVATRKGGTRIAWVCGTDLHYIETRSYPTAIELLTSWGPLNCG